MKQIPVIVVLALIAPAVLAQQQPTTPGIRTLRGVVLTASDVPLPRVRVAVTGAPATAPPVLTDERGQFTVRVPDADSVRLTFTKARYAAVTVDLRRSDLNSADATGMRVRLSLGGAISGQVRDQFGAPVMEATVTVRQMWPASPSEPPLRSATSNDLGEFRLGGLAAGVYSVGVRPTVSATVTSLEPAGEQSVNVSLGSEVSGLELTVNVPSQLLLRNGDRKPADPAATGSLRGRVLTSRGAPIAGAIVETYGGSGGAIQAVETDSRGRYVIDRLAPGEYGLRASKRGFITSSAGQWQGAVKRDRGPAVDSIDLVLARGASITGTIIDEFGEPVQDVAVNALDLRVMGGRTRALRAASVGNITRTDDRGRYRVYGLEQGTYVVQAVAGDILPGTNGYVPLFYPGTPAIDLATQTTLTADAAAVGIDLTLVPQPAFRVRGTLSDPTGTPPENRTMLTLTSARSGGIQTEPVRTPTEADGTFVFNNVAPGEYVVQATALGRAEPKANVVVTEQFAEASVTIAGDEPPPLRLKLSRGATLMGRVVYESIATPPPPYSGIALTPVPVAFDQNPRSGLSTTGFALLADNTFEYWGVFGRNVLSVRLPNPSWYLKSITYRGQDLTDVPFDFGFTEMFRDIEVVVSGAAAGVTGRVTDDRAAPVRDYTVALFPADRSKWTVRSRWLKIGRSIQGGSFKLTGVVPGDYWVVAVNRLEGTEVAGDLQNPEVLEALTLRAQRITLGEGQAQTLSLRLVRR